jgi:hypothetical protein
VPRSRLLVIALRESIMRSTALLQTDAVEPRGACPELPLVYCEGDGLIIIGKTGIAGKRA